MLIIDAMFWGSNTFYYIQLALGSILLLSFIPLIYLVIRRLHDTNLSGIYIEGNNFSKDMEEKFEKLRADNPSLTILS